MKSLEFNHYSLSTRRHIRKNPNIASKEIQCKEEAAYFARCLLMPQESVKLIYKIVKNTNRFRNKAIKEMATIFAVEVEEMRYRLRELRLLL